MHGLAEIKKLNRTATNERHYRAALAHAHSLLAEVVNGDGVVNSPGTITEAFAVITKALEG